MVVQYLPAELAGKYCDNVLTLFAVAEMVLFFRGKFEAVVVRNFEKPPRFDVFVAVCHIGAAYVANKLPTIRDKHYQWVVSRTVVPL